MMTEESSESGKSEPLLNTIGQNGEEIPCEDIKCSETAETKSTSNENDQNFLPASMDEESMSIFYVSLFLLYILNFFRA